MLLAGDIGGTKTNLGIYSADKGPREPLIEATFPSGQYPSLETLVGEFLAKVNVNIDRLEQMIRPLLLSMRRLTLRNHVNSVPPHLRCLSLPLARRQEIWRSRYWRPVESTSAVASHHELSLPWKADVLWRVSLVKGAFWSLCPIYLCMSFSIRRSHLLARRSTVWKYRRSDNGYEP